MKITLILICIVFWSLLIFIGVKKAKAHRDNKKLMKSFDDKIKKMSEKDTKYKDFTEGHIYEK